MFPQQYQLIFIKTLLLNCIFCVEICQSIFDGGLAKHEERASEVHEFWECINDAKTENKNEGMDYINEFLEYKKQVSRKVVTSQYGEISEVTYSVWRYQ